MRGHILAQFEMSGMREITEHFFIQLQAQRDGGWNLGVGALLRLFIFVVVGLVLDRDSVSVGVVESGPPHRSHADRVPLHLGFRQVGRLENHEFDGGVDDEEGEAGEPPRDHVAGQRLRDGLPAELETDEELGADDGGEHPRLPPQLITVGVVEQLEGLPEAHGAPQQHEEEPQPVDPVLGGPPQDELQVKCVELREEEEEHDAQDSQPSLEGREGIPCELDPAIRAVRVGRMWIKMGDKRYRGAQKGGP